ncbi:MAG: glycosyltransferase family 4 protein [Planctomycetota bacterium]|jgi:glycosyltransferase involved in cell wall biosynthesis
MRAAKPLGSPANILYVARSAFVGGAERSLVRIVKSLDRSRHTPYIAAEAGEDFRALLADANAPVEPVPLPIPSKRHPLQFASALWRLRRCVRRVRPAVMHVNDAPLYFVPGRVGRWLGVPRICYLRFTYEPDGLRWMLASGFERMVFASHYMKRFAQESCPELFDDARCAVVHNGFDPPPTPSKEVLAAHREALGLRGPVVGFCGQVIEVKGVSEFLEMAARVAPAHPDVTFLIVGDDKQEGENYRSRMEAQAAAAGIADRCRFVGFRRDAWDLIHLMTVLVMPSRVEPFGNVAVEGSAAGVPVVVSDVGGLSEIVVEGETGFRIPTKDPAALEAAVTRLLTAPELAARLGAAGRARAADAFTMERQARELQDLYDEVAAQHG